MRALIVMQRGIDKPVTLFCRSPRRRSRNSCSTSWKKRNGRNDAKKWRDEELTTRMTMTLMTSVAPVPTRKKVRTSVVFWAMVKERLSGRTSAVT